MMIRLFSVRLRHCQSEARVTIESILVLRLLVVSGNRDWYSGYS